MTNQPHYIKELDGLRAFAILLVIIWHYFLGQTTQETLPQYVWLGLSWSWSGVDMFFVLSGFLIGRILLFYKSSPNYFKTFYARRFFRIFPPYYILLGGYILFHAIGWAAQFPVLSYGGIPYYAYALYIQNFFMADGFGANWLAVTWSLAVEEQFYLLFPLLIYYLPKEKLPKIFLTGILLAPIIRAVLGSPQAYVLLPARMDALLVGALIAYYYQNGSISKWIAPHKRTLSLITMLVFGLMLSLAFEGSGKTTGGILNHSLYALLYGLIIINILVQQGGAFMRVLANPVLCFIGKISYSVYLFHQVILLLLTKLVLSKDVPTIERSNDILVTLLAIACTIAFASLLHFTVEKPTQKIGRKFSY